MISDTVQTVGIAGIAYAVIQVLGIAVKGLVQKKNGSNGTSGDKSADFWKLEIRGIVEKAIDERVVPKMTQIETALTTLIRWKGGD